MTPALDSSERNARTRALKSLAAGGFALDDVLDPAKYWLIERLPGLARVQLARLRVMALDDFGGV